LLGEVRVDSGQVGKALRGYDARHAGFSCASQQGHHVASFASEGGELVDDDEAWSGLLRGNAH